MHTNIPINKRTNKHTCEHMSHGIFTKQKTNRVWNTEGQKSIGCLRLQVIFRKRATNYRALVRKITYKDEAFNGSSPPCITTFVTGSVWLLLACRTRKRSRALLRTSKALLQYWHIKSFLQKSPICAQMSPTGPYRAHFADMQGSPKMKKTHKALMQKNPTCAQKSPIGIFGNEDTVALLQKSPTRAQKTPYIPESLLYLSKGPICAQKSPACAQIKRALHVLKRARHVRQRALLLYKRAVYVRKRASYARKRAVCARKRALHVRKRALEGSCAM